MGSHEERAGVADDGRRPLAGCLVVALEQAVAAPYCTQRLADAGARVIKVERPRGDSARGFDDAVRGQSSYFVWLNRNKESIVLDIKAPDDAALLGSMVARADVFVQNLAPGAAARAGFDSRALRRRHPRLITVDITGYPAGSAHAGRKAYDLLIQAETGLASVTGLPEGPGRVGVSVCDVACGMNAWAATLEALLERDRTGRGSGVEVSLFECTAEWMTVPLLFHEHAGRAPARVGLRHPSIHPYGAYATRGGPPVVVAVQNDEEFERLCARVVGRPELARDERFASNPERCRHRETLDAILEPAFAEPERGELLGRLDAARIAWGEVHDVAGLSAHGALARSRVGTPVGAVEIPAPPARPELRGAALGDVPAPGADSERLRAEFAGGAARRAGG